MIQNRLLEIINILFPYNDFLYMLQLELYYPKMYFSHLGRMFFKRNFQRTGTLQVTSRTEITKAISIFLTIIAPMILIISFRTTLLITIALYYIFSIILIPVWIGLANLFISLILKVNSRKLYKSAINKTSQISNLRSIAIVGSFGKTTTKNFLNQLVQFNYKTQMVPGNINTPDGIARWIIENLKSKTEVLIFEADGWKMGEIAQCCKLAPPDITIITNIGDQHLERLGNRRSLARTLREAVFQSKDDAKIIMSRKTAQDFNNVGINLEISPQQSIIKIDTYNPPKYLKSRVELGRLTLVQVHDLMYAIEAARTLNVPTEFIQDTIKKIEIPERRTKIAEMEGFTVLDDSYNISLTTAKSSINEAVKLAADQDKRLLVITAGIPELGVENQNSNFHLGKSIGDRADFVLVLRSILADEVITGIQSSEYKGKIHNAPNMIAAWELISQTYDSNNTFILMFPELTDLYY